jgi:osmotically-inducible protein OsmY
MTTATAADARTDEQIQQDVLAELKWEPRLAPTEIGVAVKDGIVMLSGWVGAYTTKWAAEEAALRVRGVKGVANELEVRLPIAAQRPDPEIAEAAVRALEWDAMVPSEQLDVTVSQGQVTLKGEVAWQYQRQAAERVVRRLSGVKGVTNLIVVRPSALGVPPADVQAQVEQALARSAERDALGITVAFEGSTVVLRGRVRSWAARETAERAAWMAPGVTAVDNQIAVDPWMDGDLAEATGRMLRSVKRDLLRRPVYNDLAEKVGTVDDLVLPADGSMPAAVIGVGGFLGIGTHDVAIPLTHLKEEHGRLVLPGATQDVLKAMPRFVAPARP